MATMKMYNTTTSQWEIVKAVDTRADKIGDTTTLNTTVKDSLVGAINETSNKLGNLSANGITELSLSEAIKNDRTILTSHTTQLADIMTIAPDTNNTDDTASLTALFNSGVTEIKLKRNKTYIVSSSITIPDNIKIIGYNTTIQGSGSNNIFTVGNNFYVKGVTFKNCAIAITANGKTNFKTKNCKFDTISNVAIYLYGSSKCWINKNDFYNIIKDSIMMDNDTSTVWIINNKFDNPSVYAGYSTAQTTAHINSLNANCIHVLNNVVKNNGGQGIIFGYNSTLSKGTTNCIASGNYCEGNGQEGITSFGGSNKLSSGNRIIGNMCLNNRFHQIEVWQSDNCVVEGNIVDEVTSAGNWGAITLYNSTGSVCCNNKVKHALSNGIAILASSSKCTVNSNNIFETNMANRTQPESGNGIVIDSAAVGHPSYITVKSNSIFSTNSNATTKNGIYATTTNNMGNDIDGNYITGYAASVHFYALSTCYNRATSIPITGIWEQRQKVYNISPSAGAYEGWVCVTGGTACGTAWVANTSYNLNTYVYVSNRVYKCSTSGTSSSTAPTHTTGSALDGTVTWDYMGILAVFKGFGLIQS